MDPLPIGQIEEQVLEVLVPRWSAPPSTPAGQPPAVDHDHSSAIAPSRRADGSRRAPRCPRQRARRSVVRSQRIRAGRARSPARRGSAPRVAEQRRRPVRAAAASRASTSPALRRAAAVMPTISSTSSTRPSSMPLGRREHQQVVPPAPQRVEALHLEHRPRNRDRPLEARVRQPEHRRRAVVGLARARGASEASCSCRPRSARRTP